MQKERTVLLRFRVGNHGSIRDEQTLSLVLPGLRTGAPPDGDWLGHTSRVVGIYGPNASGKSTVLRAIRFLDHAVLLSMKSWSRLKTFPHFKFLLEDSYHERPSLYEVDFVHQKTRYTYGFESGCDGISQEWLYAYPVGHPRLLFRRENNKLTFGRSLPGENRRISRLVGSNTLFLSVAASLNHPLLTELAAKLTDGIMYADYGDPDRNARIRWIRRKLEEDGELLGKTVALLRLADLGIGEIDLIENDIDAQVRKEFEKIYLAKQDDTGTDGDEYARLEDVLESYSKQLKLQHFGSGETSKRPVSFSIENESDGTIAWLSLVVPSLWVMQRGNTLIIDEIDASLHPRLTAVLISLFRDLEVNTGGGQLVFSSHDSTLLGPLAGETMLPHEIWFTEKESDGATSLYSLEEFTVRQRDNIERRYLQGRYGAIPIIQGEDIKRALIASGSANGTS